MNIDKIYAFISEGEDGEGLAGFQSKIGWIPMVGADGERAESMYGIAQDVADLSGKKVTLCEFSVRKETKVFEPK